MKAKAEKNYWLSSDGRNTYITVSSDFACPFCGRMYQKIAKHNIRRTIDGKRQYVLGHQVICNCGIRTAEYTGERQAIAAWMKRRYRKKGKR